MKGLSKKKRAGNWTSANQSRALASLAQVLLRRKKGTACGQTTIKINISNWQPMNSSSWFERPLTDFKPAIKYLHNLFESYSSNLGSGSFFKHSASIDANGFRWDMKTFICLPRYGDVNLKLHQLIKQSSTFNSSCRMYKLLKPDQRWPEKHIHH